MDVNRDQFLDVHVTLLGLAWRRAEALDSQDNEHIKAVAYSGARADATPPAVKVDQQRRGPNS
jgi:hypothetical protein